MLELNLHLLESFLFVSYLIFLIEYHFEKFVVVIKMDLIFVFLVIF